jgi:hypothetical protein
MLNIAPLVVDMEEGATTFHTADKSELINCLKITSPISIPRYKFVPVFSAKLLNVRKNQILLFHAQGEVTNETPMHTMLGYFADLRSGGTILESWPKIGVNIVQNRHHETWYYSSLGYPFPESFDEVDLTIYLYASGNQTEEFKKPVYLTVNQGYGFLSGVVLNGDSIE